MWFNKWVSKNDFDRLKKDHYAMCEKYRAIEWQVKEIEWQIAHLSKLHGGQLKWGVYGYELVKETREVITKHPGGK